MASATCDIGLIGLAVMGQNLIMNMNDHGYTVVAYNRTVAKVDEFLANEAKGTNVIGAHSIPEMVSLLKRPRRVMMLVKAGAPVDEFIEQLLPHLEPGDIIATGTPAGVAAMHKPPAWLKPGTSVRVSVEGLGYLTNPVIEALRTKRSSLQTDYQQKLETYKPSYPAMVELNNQIAEIDRAELAESDDAAGRLAVFEIGFNILRLEIRAIRIRPAGPGSAGQIGLDDVSGGRHDLPIHSGKRHPVARLQRAAAELGVARHRAGHEHDR